MLKTKYVIKEIKPRRWNNGWEHDNVLVTKYELKQYEYRRWFIFIWSWQKVATVYTCQDFIEALLYAKQNFKTPVHYGIYKLLK